MPRLLSIFLLLSLTTPLFAAEGFVENQGQWDGAFRYKADIESGHVYLEDDGLLFHLVDASEVVHHHLHHGDEIPIMHHHAFRIRFVGANISAKSTASYPLETSLNYFLGNDPDRWKSELRGHRKVTYDGIYPGVDLHVYVNGTGVKYEFELEAGVDPAIIQLELEGTEGQYLDRHGNLILQTSIEDVKESKPVASQKGRRRTFDIACDFHLNENRITYSFDSDYDPNLPLLIDPELVFSTYSGSTTNNFGYTATFDDEGHLYGGSTAFGNQYPTSTGAWDETYNGGETDVVVSKFNLQGTGVIYSTYLGGSLSEMPHSMITDEQNRLYVMGTTGSANFPTTGSTADGTFNQGAAVNFTGLGISFPNGSDMFVTALSPTGASLVGSTFLGGTDNDGLNTANALGYNYADEARGEINIGPDGGVYVASCTRSDDFPGPTATVSTGASGPQDGILVRLNPQLSAISWSAYLGGAGVDAIYSVAFGPDSTIYVCGGTTSDNYLVSTGAFDNANNGGQCDAFVTHLSADGNTLLHSTYFGTTDYDQAYFVKTDRQGRPHLFGQTEHENSDLISNVAYFDVGGGQFVTRFNSELTAVEWSTQFGTIAGRPNISPTAFLVDVCNSVYLSGWGGSVNSDLPSNNAASVTGLDVTFDAFDGTSDVTGSDFYLMVLAADGNSLLYGSFYGGNLSQEHVDGGTSRFDRSGKIYQAVCAGCGGFDDFPIKPDPGAFSEVNGDICNLGVFKMDFELPLIIADFDMPSFGCAPITVAPNNESVVQDNTSYQWILSNGQTSSAANPLFNFNNIGNYTLTLILSDPNSCNLADTMIREIEIRKDTAYTLPTIPACLEQVVTLGPDPNDYEDGLNIVWSPSGPLSSASVLNPTTELRNDRTFTMTIDYGGCGETVTQSVDVDNFPVAVSEDTIICSTTQQLTIEGTSFGQASLYEWSTDSNFQTIIATDSLVDIGNWTEGLTYYYFRATKPSGCQNWDTMLVTVADYDLRLSPDTFICMRDSTRIQAFSRNPKNTFNYLWTEEVIINDTFNQTLLTDTNRNFLIASPLEDNRFHLLALSKAVDNCFVQDSVDIEVSTLDPELVTADAEKHSAYFFEEVDLFGTPDLGNNFIGEWLPAKYLSASDVNEPTLTVTQDELYNWVVSDTEFPTCEFRDTTVVNLFEINCAEPNIFIPNAFTPDGDGNNDELFVRGTYIESLEFSVYNRWGEQVFSTTSQSEGWDGIYKDQRVEPAVYVYQLTAFCVDGARYYTKGNVTVIR